MASRENEEASIALEGVPQYVLDHGKCTIMMDLMGWIFLVRIAIEQLRIYLRSFTAAKKKHEDPNLLYDIGTPWPFLDRYLFSSRLLRTMLT